MQLRYLGWKATEINGENMSDFEKEFLDYYLQLGLGSMPKSDIDALIMHMLDKYGRNGSPPLAHYNNQAVSELLKTPVNRIKKFRYEAALKFGGRVEDQALARLLAALSCATLESEGDKICLIIEDSLAKNWLQGQLKNNQLIFDHSFNTEIIKVSAHGLFIVLKAFFDEDLIIQFEKGYEVSKKKADIKATKEAFKKVAMKFSQAAAKKAGEGVVTLFKSFVTGGL